MFYPALTAVTHAPWLIALYAGMAGFFQGGLDLVFFDELMKTVPPEYSATFVALAQSLQYLSAIAAPLVGTFLADYIGLSGALLVSAGLRLAGFVLFARKEPSPAMLQVG
jgi:MFS family permease